MHQVDLVDETFIAASPQRLAAPVADPARWHDWWPARTVEVFMDRGVKGQRWSIAGDLVGSAEIWLEEFRDGTILHYYVRADEPGATGTSADSPRSRRRADRLRREEALAWKRTVWALKQEMEAGRVVGGPGVV